MNRMLAQHNAYVFPFEPQRRLSVLGLEVLLNDAGQQTGGATGMAQFCLPAYHRSLPLHWHARTSEACFVLEGLLAVTLGEETFTARPGSLVFVPPHTRHAFWNPVAAQASYLALYMPAGLEAYWEALAKLGLASMDDLAESFDHFSFEA